MLSRELIKEALHKALSTGADYAEIFAEHTQSKNISNISGKTEKIGDSVISGVGIRIFKGTRCVSGSASSLAKEAVLGCAAKVADALSGACDTSDIILRERLFGDIHPIKIVPASVENSYKTDFLRELCLGAKGYSDEISQVSGSYVEVDHKILIATSEGLLAQDRQIRTRVSVSSVASKNGENQTGRVSPGARKGLELFELLDPKTLGEKASAQAVTMLHAGYIKAGTMPVAIENGFGGVIFHEACGHSLEASCVALGQSQFVGKLGMQIANPKVTAIDDGTIPNGWGSVNIDDEGTPARKNVLIEGALALQRKMYQADPRVADGTQAVMLYGRQKYALCNSKGLDLEDVISLARCYGMPLVSEGGEMYDGFESKKGRLQDFDLDAIAEKAVEHAVSAIGADSVPSGKYDVVFSNKTMAALLQTYASVFSAEQAQKGMSLLKGKEGERIAAPFITIVDDPRYEENYVMRTFDGEGVAAYAKNVVEDGVLVTLLHNLKTAAKAGVKSTGNASKSSYDAVVGVSPFTFYIKAEGGSETLGAERRKGLEDMLASAGEGLYITELMGLHAGANPITGDFSLSAKGFMISEGRKGTPVKNFTVSGNFFTVLREIEKVGSDLEFGNGSFGSPSVLVRDMSIGGKE